MIKRIFIPTMTAVFLFLTVMGVCAKAYDPDEDYELLNHLNIVGEDYANYQTKNNISENEFLRVLIRFVTEDDVSANNAYDYAMSRNIISKTDKRELGSAISYERALSLTLNVLGYAGLVEFNGQDTSAVLSLADEHELTKRIDLKVGERLNGKAMITLLANAAEAKVIEVGLKNNNFTYKKSDTTLLEAYREIEKITARVTETSDTSLYGEDGVSEDRIGIDGRIYYIDYDYSDELLGQTVYAYIDEDKALYVTPRYKDIETIEINGEDIVSVADDYSSIKYDNGSKDKTLRLAPAMNVIYNGKNYTGYTADDLMPQTGKIVCTDYDRDGRFDIIFVYSYETIVVKSISTLYSFISNAYDTPGAVKSLDLSDTSIDLRIYSDGQPVTIGAVTVDNVLSVARSKSKNQIVTMYIGKESVKGTARALNNTDDAPSVTVDDTEYGLNRAYSEILADDGSKVEKISIGGSYDFFFDVFGNIAFVKSDRLGGYEYVYFLRQWQDEDEEHIGVKFMTMDDEWEKVRYTDKLTYNGQTSKALNVYDKLGGAYMEPQLVLVKRNEDGDISALKAAVKTDTYQPDRFTKTAEVTKNYEKDDNSFNCRHYLKYDVIVILKPQDAEDKYNEEEYDVTTVSYFRDDRDYTYIAYNVDEFGYPDAVELKDIKSNSTDTFYVNKVTYTLNEDNEAVMTLEGNYNGIEGLRISEKPGSINTEVKKGDITEIKLRNGRIADLTVTGSAESMSKSYLAPPDDYTVHRSVISGDVIGVDAARKMIKVDCKTEEIPIYIPGEADIEIYDKNEKKFMVGTVDDIYEGNYVKIAMASKVSSMVVIQE